MGPTLPTLDGYAISGLTGSVSICYWIVVFTPQILENFRRQSGDGLSVAFLAIWLAGDVANLLGGVFQDVLPTMIILAVYYTLADIVLICQVYYYRWKSTIRRKKDPDASHLSPATPLLDNLPEDQERIIQETPLWRAVAYNIFSVFLVCLAGVFGWWVSQAHEKPPKPIPHDEIEIDFWGQVFGWICAALYLGSRLPQILLNFRRKSCDGISLLFFLFACIGNLTFCMSILASSLEPRNILANLSWLVGAFGTLLLDLVVFVQFFIYQEKEETEA